MPKVYIQEATYQFSSFYPPGNWSNFRVLERVIQVSSLEYMRRLEVPERSIGGYLHVGCLKDTSRKLHINFQVSTHSESSPTPGFSKASSKCHPWSL